MDVCVCLSGADGRVVAGRATLFRHHREVSRVRIPGRMVGLPWMLCVVFVLCRPEKRERRREGGRGWLGKVLRSPAAPHKEKGEKQADRKKVLDRPSGERGKAILKKKKLITTTNTY
jgi:hypothetical protein